MLRTFEAMVEPDGTVRLNEPIALATSARALVTILGPVRGRGVCETALLSEAALAGEWSSEAEDAAWTHLAELPVGDDPPATDRLPT